MPHVPNRRFKNPSIGPPRTTLDAYLRRERMLLDEMALRLREHVDDPTWPSAKTVSHWRCGRRVPSAPAKKALEQVSGGAIAVNSWREFPSHPEDRTSRKTPSSASLSDG